MTALPSTAKSIIVPKTISTRLKCTPCLLTAKKLPPYPCPISTFCFINLQITKLRINLSNIQASSVCFPTTCAISIAGSRPLGADTTGIILITNDGQFNHRVTSPKHKVPKLYRVTLKHPADDTLCTTLKNGVLLHDDNETVAAAEAVLADPTTLMMTITEGKYHQVKRMVAAAGNRVEQLHREKFGDWNVDDLAAGEWKFIQI